MKSLIDTPIKLANTLMESISVSKLHQTNFDPEYDAQSR